MNVGDVVTDNNGDWRVEKLNASGKPSVMVLVVPSAEFEASRIVPPLPRDAALEAVQAILAKPRTLRTAPETAELVEYMAKHLGLG